MKKQTKHNPFTHALYYRADGSHKRVDFIPTTPEPQPRKRKVTKRRRA